MAVLRSTAEKWKEVTGCFLAEGWGLTEASPLLTWNPLDGTGKAGSIGFPLASTDLRIVDDDGLPVKTGEIGEIQAAGPQIMKGYFNRPKATKEAIVNGWLNTGDIGYMDKHGFFYITDRKKDMIIISGFNVYPNEIEDYLAYHPKIKELAVIGIPDAKSGEAVKAFVVKRDESLTEEEVIAYCRKGLVGYKVPRIVVFIDEVPKSTVGKLLRRELRDRE